MIIIDDFFKPATVTVFNEDYNVIPDYVKAIDIFAKTTYQSVYLIDYHKKGFLYVSENPLFLCGLTSKQVLEMGYNFYFEKVPEKDLEMLEEINRVGFRFFEGLNFDKKNNVFISYDFHLRHPGNKLVLVNHKLKPLLLDKSQNVWISLCVVSVSTHSKAGNIEIQNTKEGTTYLYSLTDKIWIEKAKIKLTEREKEILLLSARGFSVDEIAENIFLSPDTIKFHRRNLYKKMGVQSIAEAISYATTYNLI